MKMNVLALLTAAVFAIVFCLMFPEAIALGQHSVAKADYVVCKPVINMYSSPSRNGDVVSQAIYGTGVLSLKKTRNWIHIRTGDNYTGWIDAVDVTALHGNYAPDEKVVRVAELSANVYREPDVTKHAPLLNLPWEARLELAEKVDEGSGWVPVRLVNGQKAYVERGDVSADFSPLTIDQTIELARKFLGITYTWGGVSSYGYDCSGFTQMLLRQRGILMPRDADVQARWSGVVPVQRANLKPGDLLFFGESATDITHTGMFIGGGKFIHDTTNTHPAIQISKLDDLPWTRLLVAARRAK